MLKIFKYLKKEDWLIAAVSLVLVVAQVGLDLKLPDYMSEITRMVQTQGQLELHFLLLISTDPAGRVPNGGDTREPNERYSWSRRQDAGLRPGQSGTGRDRGIFQRQTGGVLFQKAARRGILQGGELFHGGDQRFFHPQSDHPFHQ